MFRSIRTAPICLLIAALALWVPDFAAARGGGGGHGGGHAGGHAHAHGGARVAHHRFASRPMRSSRHAFASRSVSSTFHADHGHNFRHLRPGWDRGHWHHGRHVGHLGWWWVVGGIWYYYPDDYRDEYPYEADDPPRYVSEIAVPQASFASEPDLHPVYVERDHAIYYAPGDSVGVSYHTGTQCAEAQRKAGGAGICMVK